MPPAAKVIDATGAGDSFNGGYLAARLNGASPVEAARAGTVMAARVIAAHGAIIDLPELGGSQKLQDIGIPTFTLTAFALSDR